MTPSMLQLASRTPAPPPASSGRKTWRDQAGLLYAETPARFHNDAKTLKVSLVAYFTFLSLLHKGPFNGLFLSARKSFFGLGEKKLYMVTFAGPWITAALLV